MSRRPDAPLYLDDRAEGSQGDAEIGWVGGDALPAPAEDGVQAGLAAGGITAGAGFAFVARRGGVVEVGAPGSLQQVAADGRRIAELGGCAGEQCLGDGRIVPGEGRVIRQVRIADEGADAHAAVWQCLDAVEPGEPADIDHVTGPHDAALHQVQQVRPGGQVGGPGHGAGPDGFCDAGRAGVFEAVHAASLRSAASMVRWASSTASVMPI